MSRIGKKPVEVPKGVTVTITGGDAAQVAVKGPKGQLAQSLVTGVSVSQSDGVVVVTRESELKKYRANHGLMRALIANMVTGVTKGFERKLEVHGIGYKAEVKGKSLHLNLGYSHPIDFVPPAGVNIAVEKTTITVTGIDKEKVGQTAAVIRGFRPPDSYKGKGVRYAGEYVRTKDGKSAKN